MSYPTYTPIVLWNQISDWSQRTFGIDSERGPVGVLKHLKKEADEAIADPKDLKEYADCLILILDASRRAGFEMEQLFEAALEKIELNKIRTYPKPVGDEVSEHDRS